MIDFTDEQKLARKMLRQWTDKELAPHVAKLEKGELLPYDLGRKLIAAFGIDELVRAQFAKLAEAPASPSPSDKGERGGVRSDKGERGGVLGDVALMAIVSMELSRVCPGFCLAFGASLG